MSWQETFGVFGLDPEDTAKSLDVYRNRSGYVPVAYCHDVKGIYCNPFQKGAIKVLKQKGLIGVIDGSQSYSGFEVYRRGSERSYEVRLPEPVKLSLSMNGATVNASVDTLVVKTWNYSNSEDAKTEMRVLEIVNRRGYQNPNTIPLVGFSTPGGIQLIKIREPRVTYSDLPTLIGHRSYAEREKVFSKLTAQVFQNWAKLAANNLFQLSMIPMDHRPKKIKWMYRCGGGDLREGLEGLANAGFLKVGRPTSCIVRDMEHVMEKKQIWATYKYRYKDGAVQKSYFANKFEVALGTAIASNLLMAGNVGCQMRLKTPLISKVLEKNLRLTYSLFHGRRCDIDFEVSNKLIESIRNFSSRTAVGQRIIYGKKLDNAIDPLFIDSFIENAFRSRRSIEACKDEISENLAKASRISTEDTIGLLFSLQHIRLRNNQLTSKVFRKATKLATKRPEIAINLVDKIADLYPQTQKEVEKILSTYSRFIPD